MLNFRVLFYDRGQSGPNFLTCWGLTGAVLRGFQLPWLNNPYSFFFLGWGHHLPVTDGAKIITMLTAIFGIPLTFIMIISGSTLIARLAKEAEIKMFGNRESGTHKFDRPIMVGFVLMYMFATASIIMQLERMDYFNALWYTLMSLMTVGYTDIVQRRRGRYAFFQSGTNSGVLVKHSNLKARQFCRPIFEKFPSNSKAKFQFNPTASPIFKNLYSLVYNRHSPAN